MPPLSPVLKRFSPSPISGIFSTAQKLKASGADIADFSVGEPDFDTPAHICAAAHAAIDRGETRYTPTDGSVALRQAIRKKFAEENGLDYRVDQIIAAVGAKPLLALAMQAVLTEGTEAIIAAPCWPSHVGQIELAGGKPAIVATTAASGFKLTAAQLEQAITPRTRMLLLCSPSNPTGAVYSADELKALADVLLRHPGIWILSDDLYEHIVFDGLQFATIAAVEPRLADRVLTINGLSKGYAMTGWRIGFAGGPQAWIDGIRQLATQAGGGLCSISQAAAIAALNGPKDFMVDWRRQYQRRRDIGLAGLARTNRLSTARPDGAFYLFPDCSGTFGLVTPKGQTIRSSGDFGRYLIEDWGVVAVPGTAFSSDAHLRLSIATSEAVITDGIDRIVRACNALTAP